MYIRKIMENLQILFFLLLSAVLMVGVAQKINVPYPLILILGGAAISFLPGHTHIYFDPNLLLLIVLPPVLYHSAFGISFREFQADWKNIFSLALGLVALTTVVIALIFKWLFPDYSWALAFAFGAIISPPDAVAVTSILKRFSIHSRLVTLLEGESLINDASAIVIYKITVVALMTGTLSLTAGIEQFFYVVTGGIIVGLVFGLLSQEFSRRYLEPVLGVVFSFIIPYVTYILAHLFSVSGVLAVVVNGLIGSRLSHSHHSPLRRVLGYAVWDVYIILLNCLVFILIGLQIRTISEKMTHYEMITYTGYALLFSFAMVVVRMIFVYTRAGIVYIRSSQHSSQMFKESLIAGWAGMRGIVSLAVALSLPFTTSEGLPLAGRDEVVFMTFMVIFITLIVPGITLPFLIQWLNLRSAHKTTIEQEIRQQLAHFTEEKLKDLHQSNRITQKEYRFLNSYFHSQHKVLELAHKEEKALPNIEIARREVIQYQRSKLIELWKLHQLDDKHFTHLENELDMLETHTARAELKK